MEQRACFVCCKADEFIEKDKSLREVNELLADGWRVASVSPAGVASTGSPSSGVYAAVVFVLERD